RRSRPDRPSRPLDVRTTGHLLAAKFVGTWFTEAGERRKPCWEPISQGETDDQDDACSSTDEEETPRRLLPPLLPARGTRCRRRVAAAPRALPALPAADRPRSRPRDPGGEPGSARQRRWSLRSPGEARGRRERLEGGSARGDPHGRRADGVAPGAPADG